MLVIPAPLPTNVLAFTSLSTVNFLAFNPARLNDPFGLLLLIMFDLGEESSPESRYVANT